MGTLLLCEEKHAGEVVVYALLQALTVQDRAHSLLSNDLDGVLVALLQLLEQKVDLPLQDHVFPQENIGPRPYGSACHPPRRRPAIPQQAAPALRRLRPGRLQFGHFPAEQRLLLIQKIQGHLHRAPFQVGSDLLHRHPQLPLGPDDIQSADVLDGIHSVAVLPPLRVEQPFFLVVPQGIRMQTEELGDLMDFIEVFHFSSSRVLTFG